MTLYLILAIELLSSVAQAAIAKEMPRIKVIVEEAADDPRHPAELQRKLRHKRASGIEFRDKTGKVKRTLDFSDHLRKRKEHEERSVEVKIPKSSVLVIVEKRTRDWDEKNPYQVRRTSNTEVEWYDQDGSLIGKRLLRTGSHVVAVSDDGSATAVVDSGFDSESLANAEVSGMTNTAVVKNDSELLDHRLTFYRQDSSVIVEQTFPGPSAPPEGVMFSPSGEWAIYSLGSVDSYLRNLRAGTVEKFGYLPISWSVENDGRLVGWRNEGQSGRWEEFQGQKVWKSSRSVKQRKFVREPGAIDAVRTEETREKNL